MPKRKHEDDKPKTMLKSGSFRIAADRGLENACYAYKTSEAVKNLKSEEGRRFHFEIVRASDAVPHLSELAIKVLGANLIPPPYEFDCIERGVYIDGISVELPLERCIGIQDQLYWRNVVLAKTKDFKLHFAETYNWRALGLSLKYTEMIENCTAEYWPHQLLHNLAMKIKDEVTVMHINKLQPLQEQAFAKLFLSESDTDYESGSEQRSTTISTVTSSESTTMESTESAVSMTMLNESLEEEEQSNDVPQASTSQTVSKRDSKQSVGETASDTGGDVVLHLGSDTLQLKKNISVSAMQAYEKSEKKRIRAEKIEAKEAQNKRRAHRLEMHRIREAKIDSRRNPSIVEEKKSKKPQKIKVRGVFDLPIEPEPPAADVNVCDRRNPELYLKRKHKFNYHADFCHHVDLSVLRLFENLVEFKICFYPGTVQHSKYHSRYYNVSQHDITRLAHALAALSELRKFSLRESRIDGKKLESIVHALVKLPYLEEVDLSFNGLADDSGTALKELLSNCSALRHLELEGNNLGKNAMRDLSIGFQIHQGSFIEYLGLANNIIGDEGLHWLVIALIKSGHVRDLCLAAIMVTSEGISCCVGNELLRAHNPLISLDLRAIPIDKKAIIDMLKGMFNNRTVQHIDVRTCGLEFKYEYELDTLLKRNRFVTKNAFIYQPGRRVSEIEEYCKSARNPQVLNVEKHFERLQKCLAERPDEKLLPYVEPSSHTTLMSFKEEESEHSVHSEQKPESIDLDYPAFLRVDRKDPEPFVYEANNFDLEQYKLHVHAPGIGNRYNYMVEQAQAKLSKRRPKNKAQITIATNEWTYDD